MQADEFFRVRRGPGKTRDGQRRRIGGEEAARGEQRLGLLGHLRFQIALLEHRFDDQVATGEVFRVRGRLDEQQLVRVLLPALEDFRAVGLARFRLLQEHVLQHAGHAAIHVRPGDAAAHHAGAEDADLRRLPFRQALRPRRAGFDRGAVEEERDQVFCHLSHGEAREIARLDAQRGVEVHVGAFDHRRHDRLGRRIQAARFLDQHRRRHRQHLRDRRRRRPAARHAVLRVVPGLHRRRIRGDPFARHLEEVCLAGGQPLHEAQLRGVLRPHRPAFDEVGKRRLQTEQARPAAPA